MQCKGPYMLGQQKSSERVQKRALRLITGHYDKDYMTLLNENKYLLLHQRRNIVRLCTCYKILMTK